MPQCRADEEPPFWYALDDAAEISCPAFILDTRSERQRFPVAIPPRLMKQKQMDAFVLWLESKAHDDRPKFVFLGSPIIPLTRDYEAPDVWMRQDGPTGYPGELSHIVRVIVEKQIQRVVFVGGDPHLSCAAPMKFQLLPSRESVRSLHIVSSGLYSPLPFANMSPDDVNWRQNTISLPGCQIEYTPELLVSGPPHFLRVSANQPTDSNGCWTITVEAYAPSGDVKRVPPKPIKSSTYRL